MNCSYTLEDEILYTVKYYLGDKEFYRYTPEEDPPIRVIGISEFKRQLIKEDGALELLGVSINATGLYKCEVSTDAPFFTVVDSAFVTVVEEPEDIPTIFTRNQSLRVGSVVKSSCTSRGGFPLANLTWFVDGEQVTYPDLSRTKQYTVEGEGNVESSVSELTLPIVSALSNGQLHLRCEASQFALYNASAEVVLNEETSSSSVLLVPFIGCVGGRESVIVSTYLMAAGLSIVYHLLLACFSVGSLCVTQTFD